MNEHAEDSDEHCIFCKIIRGEIPCSKIFENDRVLAFLDIGPAARGHALVVVKAHAATLSDVPETSGNALLSALQKVGRAVMEECGATGFNCVQNNFPSAGQVVPHVHWHVIPRFDEDELFSIPAGQYSSTKEMQLLAAAVEKRII